VRTVAPVFAPLEPGRKRELGIPPVRDKKLVRFSKIKKIALYIFTVQASKASLEFRLTEKTGQILEHLSSQE
jgi:hypothetical protein